MEALMQQTPVVTWSASTTAPATGTTYALAGRGVSKITYVTRVSGPSSLALAHEVSNDNVTFAIAATDSSTTGTTGTFETSALYYRNRMVAGTGAGTTSVTLSYGLM